MNNLETIGSFQIGPDKNTYQIGPRMNMDTLELPGLTAIMSGVIINGAWIRISSLPELTKIDGGLQLVYLDSLKTMAFPKLAHVLQDIFVQGSNGAGQLQTIDFPSLERIGGSVTFSSWPRLGSVRLPLLQQAASMNITNFPALTSIEMPLLKNLGADANFSGNGQLEEFDLSSLQTVGGNLYLQNLPLLEDLDGLKSLTAIGKSLNLNTLIALKDISGLKSLESVGENLIISQLTQLKDDNLEGLSSLKTVGGSLNIYRVPFKKFSGFGLPDIKTLSIDGNGISSIQEIDISKLNIETSLSLSNISTSFLLKGKDVYDCSVSLQNCNTDMAKNMSGFKEIKDLTFQYYVTEVAAPDQGLPVQKVSNNFTLYISAYNHFSLPYLKEVGGNCNVVINSKMDLDLPVLKTAGKLSMNLTGSGMDVLSLPSLETVDGDCSFTTGNPTSSVGDIHAPELTTINGILNISGQYTNYENTRMINLNGFSSVKNVQGITVAYNKQLTDFSGLKNAIASVTADKWAVTGNKYNPTYQDMMDGKYVQQ